MEKRSVKAGFHTSLLFILHVLYIVYTSEPEKESDIEKAHRYHIDMPSEKYDNKEAIKQIHLYRMPLSHFLYYPFLKFVSHHKAYYQ